MHKTVLVIDTKLVMYFQYHRHKHPFNCFQDIARVVSEVVPQRIDKVIWARDEGKSKRAEFYPEYKAHRVEEKAKQPKAEQRRRAEFEELYRSSKDFLRYFGSVISISGYEADDIAGIVAMRYAGEDSVNVILFSSDEDWARFLYADNIKLLHYQRAVLIGADDVEKEFEVPFGYQLFVDSIRGVKKENVDGIKNAGKKRVLKALTDSEFVIKDTITTLQEWCDIHKYGMQLPDWAESVQDVYDRNIKIFSPLTLEDFSKEERALFIEQWESRVRTTPDDLLIRSVGDFGYVVQPTSQMKRIFNLF